ncbi:hypothetical protein B0A50_05614 [Salinomyces thailandicus]|uniref:AB hydrolase-1 domain-containing protein n=1 Tax=Salinomyces thailandicus TaxID=706561 RepID=A0A4V5N6H0_9PEZI|nr:hypothetical protein B0A50_05614 [Salinomyces thailandica]
MQAEQNAAAEAEAHIRLPDGHHLYLKLAGFPRPSSKTPVIVLIHGLGGTAREWLDVQRRIAHFAPVLLYERGGYHGSDPPVQIPTCENIASELRTLLSAANIEPPYLLVGHSYGGVIARQVLNDLPSDIAGMVLVDSVPVVNRFPSVWEKLLGDATCEDVVGLQDNHAMPEEEWQAIGRDTSLNEMGGGIAEQELNLMAPANDHLNASLQGWQALGNHRLCVLFCYETRDFQKVYEHGMRHGHGTVEEREVVRKHLETMSIEDEAAQRTPLALSSHARFVKAEGERATHNVHFVDPAWVVEQIRWVYDGSVNTETT